VLIIFKQNVSPFGLIPIKRKFADSFFNTKDSKGFTKGTKEVIMDIDLISNKVIGSALKVHSALGPGLLESAYKECMFYMVRQNGLIVEKEKPIPLTFNDVKLDCGYRIDLLVENKLVIEIKSVEEFHPLFIAQVLTYLRIGKFNLGLLINFNVEHLKHGIKRIIL
jgi:GxxExxY protein